MKIIKRLLFKNYLGIAIGLIVIVGLALTLMLNNYEPAQVTNASTIVSATAKKDTPPATEETDTTDSTDLSIATPETDTAPEEQATPSTQGILSCTDCMLAAVDKNNALPISYTPSVMATGLAGGGSLTANATSALRKLFTAAQSAGITPEIISAYRSYATQEATFNFWVETEMANGLTRMQAEAEANTYSARPGQSEHQLGTTVDLKCAGCGDFDASQNAEIYAFIEENAHLYGFVVSYPKGQEALTGYTYEPWHIRYIGTDLAQQLFATGYTSSNGNYLARFLANL